MRTALFTLLFCLSIINTQAQPTLSSDEMLGYGSVMHLQYLSDFDVIDTGIQGADVVWDFSNLTSSSYSDDLFVEIVDPATTPLGYEFPNANYAYKETPLLNYRYFILDDNEMKRVGSIVNNQLNFYTNPQTEIVFPLNLGTTNNDTWDNTNSSSGGTYNISCVGYGKLIIPSGTYDNALMVRVELTELTELIVYFWYSADDGSIILEYSEGDGFFYPEFGLQLIDLDVMVSTANNQVVDNVIYTNPVQSTLTVNLFSNDFSAIQYHLVDMNGRLIHSAQLAVTPEKHRQLQLDMSYLNTGMYFLHLSSDNGRQTCKIIKI